jgi:serine/threonine protein kinase
LSAIHAAGVVHRDFKSDNVFLVPHATRPGLPPWRAVVVDFGLARSTAEEVRRSFPPGGVVVGTAAYMAPEQLLGEAVSPQSDIYALGVVLFEALTGTLPFPGRTFTDSAVRRVREAAPAPSSIRSDVPPLWDAIVGRCLARAPDDRFARVEEILEALGGAPLPRRTRQRVQKRWRGLLEVGAAVGVVALTATVLARRTTSPSPARPLPAAEGPGPRVETVDIGRR